MRFALIDMLDCVVLESNNPFDLTFYCAMNEIYFDSPNAEIRLYDYERQMFITDDDVSEMTLPR